MNCSFNNNRCCRCFKNPCCCLIPGSTGPQGPAGPQGPQGPQGPTGPAGGGGMGSIIPYTQTYLYTPSPFAYTINHFVMPVDGTLNRFVLSFASSPKPIYFELYASPFTTSPFLETPEDRTVLASGQFVQVNDSVAIVDQIVNASVPATTRISLLVGVNEELPTLVEGVISGGLLVVPD